MDRLHALDAEFLYVEDGIAHAHIAGVSIFEGPVPSEDEIAALLTSKFHLIPRYRQRVCRVPFDLGRPVWVDDAHFEIGYHLRHTALPAPGDEAVLDRLVGRLMSQALDPRRPLWEVWIVEGLSGGRWALICKVHHCMVDGIAGVGLLTALLDVAPDAPLPEPVPWEPEPTPGAAALVVDALGGLAGDVAQRTVSVAQSAFHPRAAAHSAASIARGVAGFGRHLQPAPPCSLEGSIGPHRRWASSTVELADVKAVGRALGGTVNDVVLAAVTRGYRDLLLAHGELPDEAVVRTLVPVSVRHDDARGVADNRVSAMLVELPVELRDPVERLAEVRRRMADVKASHMVELGEWATRIADLAPPMLLSAGTKLAMRMVRHVPQPWVNTVTTNVPGPQFPLYCLGRRMLEHRPFVPVAPGVRVGTAILSYDGKVCFGVTGDFATVPDVDVLAGGIRTGVEELVVAAGAIQPEPV